MNGLIFHVLTRGLGQQPAEGVTEEIEEQTLEEVDIDPVNLDESVASDTPAPEAKVTQSLIRI